jgi:hypothetical protein
MKIPKLSGPRVEPVTSQTQSQIQALTPYTGGCVSPSIVNTVMNRIITQVSKRYKQIPSRKVTTTVGMCQHQADVILFLKWKTAGFEVPQQWL